MFSLKFGAPTPVKAMFSISFTFILFSEINFSTTFFIFFSILYQISRSNSKSFAAKADEKVAAALEGKSIVKEIYVPGRIVNIVAK